MWLTGPVAPWHVGSSQTRARTRVPCIGRQILSHCATREALSNFLKGVSLAKFIGLLFSSVSWMVDAITFYMLSCHSSRSGFLAGPSLWLRDRIFSSFPGIAVTFGLTCSRRLSGSKVKSTLIIVTFFNLRNMVVFTMILNILVDIHVKFL